MAALKSEPLSALPWWQAADHLEELGEEEWAACFRARGDLLSRGTAGFNFFYCYPSEVSPINGSTWALHVLGDPGCIRYLDKHRLDLGWTDGAIPSRTG